MELISEILTIAYGYSKGTHQRADYLTGEGSWFGMTVLGIMLAVVIYWAVWNIKAACQKKKDDKSLRKDMGEWFLQNGEWIAEEEERKN